MLNASRAFSRADQAVGPLVEGVHRRQAVGLLLAGEVVVDRVEHRLAACANRFVVDAAGQVQVLHREAAVGRVAAEAERGEGELTGSRVPAKLVGWLGMQTYGGRLLRDAELVADDAAHAREDAAPGWAGSR